jgi:hypothetical protein
MILLYAYLLVTALVATRQLTHMLFALDRFDWKHDRMQIWVNFALMLLLWPLILFTKPKSLFVSDLEDRSPLADRERAMYALVHNPPPCSSRVVYRTRADEGSAEFYFDASTLTDLVRARLAEGHDGYYEEHMALLGWLERRDATITTATEVPEVCSHFYWMADEEARAGNAEVRCCACNETIQASHLVGRDDKGLRGWNSNRLLCQKGHLLLEYRATHILLK